MRVSLPAAVLLSALAVPAMADETTGEVLAFDRVDLILVLKDKTIWSLEATDTIPEGLKSGDTVRIVYESAGEDGLTKIDSLERLLRS